MSGSELKKGSSKANILRSFLPIATWLPRYELGWLRADIMAGLAVWAMIVPQALAYAGIAGVAPVYGLYAVPLAMLAYALFGTSSTLSAGPESAIAIISAVTVGALAAGDAEEFLLLTTLLAFMVGILFLVFGLLRLGWVANFLSQPVLKGFTQGIALTVIVGQIPVFLGTSADYSQLVDQLSETWHTGFFLKAWAVAATVGHANIVTAVVGLAALTLLFVLKRFVPLAPSALIAVFVSVLAVWLLGLQEQGVNVIGEIETGMISLSMPAMSIEKITGLLPGALAIVLLGYAVSLGVAEVGAQETGEQIDANQELVALGVANIGAALSSGFVVCGSLSRGVVTRGAGGRTQVVSLVNGALVLLTLIILLPLFFRLPNATLAAVVIQAMCGLLSFAYFQRLFRIDRAEFGYGLAALLGVLVLGILQGVAIGVLISLAVLVRRVSRPGIAILGRILGTDDFRDIDFHSAVETFDGLLIFRFDAPIIFCNAGYFAEQIHKNIAKSETPIREVLLSVHQINQLDSTGADQIERLQKDLAGKQIGISLAETKVPLRESMRRTGLEDTIGADRFYESISDGVQAFLERQEQSPGEQSTPESLDEGI